MHYLPQRSQATKQCLEMSRDAPGQKIPKNINDSTKAEDESLTDDASVGWEWKKKMEERWLDFLFVCVLHSFRPVPSAPMDLEFVNE